ncbi:MAG: VWA domain-containing protein [Calditrichaeota bacterium]|nr:VWA domain-containing protein [Calditrichota bacterium]
MIRFAKPELLHLLWLVIPLLFLIWLENRWRQRAMAQWANESLWNTALPTRAPFNILVKRLFSLAALALMILAVAGPQVGTRLINVTREGADIAIALDCSQSMQAEDFTPNRMQKARFEIGRLLGKLRGDRVAFVPFAGVAFVQVPLTLDYSAVMSMMNAFEPGVIPMPGTAIAEAVKQARRAFKAESKAQKILLLITDGEDHESGVIEQAKEAAREGIIIITIGMASPAGAPIPEKDRQGRIVGYKQERGGGTVISRLNEDLLIKIAQATGGEYYRATPSGDEFHRVYERITGMDKEKFEQKQFTDYEDRFQWPLMAAFLLIIIEEWIPMHKRRRTV